MAILQIALAILGALSVFLGYRLFCDSPARILSGALLALFGVAILSADLVGPRGHVAMDPKPPTHHARPTGLKQHAATTDWFV